MLQRINAFREPPPAKIGGSDKYRDLIFSFDRHLVKGFDQGRIRRMGPWHMRCSYAHPKARRRRIADPQLDDRAAITAV